MQTFFALYLIVTTDDARQAGALSYSYQIEDQYEGDGWCVTQYRIMTNEEDRTRYLADYQHQRNLSSLGVFSQIVETQAETQHAFSEACLFAASRVSR